MPQRMFVALIPPSSELDELERFMGPRWGARDAASRAPWRWTRPESWHITLAFLPGVAERSGDRLDESLRSVADRSAPFSLQLGRGVCFPDAAHAKLLALGLQGDTQQLTRMAESVRAAASHAGVEVAGGKFVPHLSLGRSNRGQSAAKWLDLLDTYQSEPWQVQEIQLVASYLGHGPGGSPRYDVVARYPVTD